MAYKILTVDDSNFARMLLKKAILEAQSDVEISEADCAEAALKMLAGNSYDIFFIDVNMPGTNGFELAMQIREQLPEAHLAILTANIQDASQKKAQELGAAFIAKPVTTEKIRSFLQQVGETDG
ncbi:response regulator [Terasakiella sp. SH-1]|uniref:response regulator n=1 Tax=Terasakiella sp. SH-1 TaxID=2560057 RepID=UPI001074668B|nr:response regulator [Terasakiella sp. SH-1]